MAHRSPKTRTNRTTMKNMKKMKKLRRKMMIPERARPIGYHLNRKVLMYLR
jgi:hypothetical protein